ncbi:uracil-DNA glycosylase family protein [uncultured Maribacter sp.]|uniref:uracil-DNA glycosylase family protein n=1 Tax=uncultured Maribacter sp. TaxID=431308 RepID=UPI00262E2B53|nr:uracil-DNA glycosylase family protein [uncultured Maribacter sp.]
MFLHTHPYEPFLFKEATKLIVGTLPPPRFTTGDLKEDDVDFCYGSRNGMLWPVLDRIFDLNLKYETTAYAADQRRNFLLQRKIGVCDIVGSARRDKIDASDLGMKQIELRNIVGYLKEYTNVQMLIFTGGNSKNGPEFFFRKHLKENGLSLAVENNEVPRIHSFIMPNSKRKIITVSLTAPSGTANRAIGSTQAYKELKKANPKFNTLDFRVMQYEPFF